MGKAEDVVRDYIPVGKMKRIASSVHDILREAPEVSKVVNLAARGKASALARSADRPMLRRTQARRREEDMIVKGSARMWGGRDADCRNHVEQGGLKENESPTYSTQPKAYIYRVIRNRPVAKV